MEILEFVRLEEVDPLYFDSSFFALPEEAGQKAYELLVRTMEEAGYAAGSQSEHAPAGAHRIGPGSKERANASYHALPSRIFDRLPNTDRIPTATSNRRRSNSQDNSLKAWRHPSIPTSTATSSKSGCAK